MDAGNHSLRSLEPFLLMAKSAKGAGATKLIADATSAPGTYVFAELLEMPNIQELGTNEQHAPWLELLKVFSYRTWTDYKRMATIKLSGSLPQLNPAQATKLKQLSIVSLAERSRASIRSCSYLHSPYDVLKGKLDQKEARIEIEYTIGRDLEPGAAGLQVLLSKLREWSNRTSTVIQALDVQIQGIKDNERGAADAAKEYEGERVAMATQIAEVLVLDQPIQVVEDAMATGGGAPSGSSADAQRSTRVHPEVRGQKHVGRDIQGDKLCRHIALYSYETASVVACILLGEQCIITWLKSCLAAFIPTRSPANSNDDTALAIPRRILNVFWLQNGDVSWSQLPQYQHTSPVLTAKRQVRHVDYLLDFQNANRWCFNLDLGQTVAQAADLFSAAAARGAGQVLLVSSTRRVNMLTINDLSYLFQNIFLPSLLFSKIVPGYTVQNIVALALYPATAVIMSMTASAPFSPGDSDVAVAYLSAFILVFFVTLFPFGGSRIIEKDFMDKSAPVDADDEIPESASSRLRRRWGRLQIAIQNRRGAVADSDIEGSPASEQDEKVTEIATPKPKLSRHVSFNPSEPTAYNGPDGGQSTRPPSAHVSPAPTVVEGIHNTMSQNPKDSTRVVPVSTETGLASTPEIRSSRFKRALLSTRAFLKSLASPATSSMVVSFIVALVPQLKALFIAPPAGSNIHIHHAPDGLPPLNMIMDTATFIGNASVPLGLICLGSALARLQVPKPISRAPLGAITLFSILKMVVGPVFGVLVVEALTHHTSLIDPNDKVLRFVCIYFAGVPTATTQVYLTQIYSPDGSASHVSAFLIPQYALSEYPCQDLS
ncbi:auxin efflux carrier transmembrane protein [Rhizoctonia solani AG-1 IA]|uniref:Auxin efflux carrier transmembrane protein n=1 Tax=Thanatephorus cucumeris (strain AG1-IA) TaxID=983506 RepID=L8WVL9_THACA|nr:auxin efflux carrier transmembrane protein [Rhizoctonia solani AG-1 IA]